jgi:hypothetical protein
VPQDLAADVAAAEAANDPDHSLPIVRMVSNIFWST